MGAAAAGPIRTAAAESSGRKHDAMVVGEHTILRVKTWLSLSAAGLLSVGCRPPALIDPLGHPVSRPMLVASLEDGRIVIDSSGDGVRAVVELMRTLPDAVAKSGAEALCCVGLPGLGIAVRVEDGAWRAVEPAVIAVLSQLLEWRQPPDALVGFARPEIRNTPGDVVGFLHAQVPLERVS